MPESIVELEEMDLSGDENNGSAEDYLSGDNNGAGSDRDEDALSSYELEREVHLVRVKFGQLRLDGADSASSEGSIAMDFLADRLSGLQISGVWEEVLKTPAVSVQLTSLGAGWEALSTGDDLRRSYFQFPDTSPPDELFGALTQLHIYGALGPRMMEFLCLSRNLLNDCVLNFLSVDKFLAENANSNYAKELLELVRGRCYEIVLRNPLIWKEGTSYPVQLNDQPLYTTHAASELLTHPTFLECRRLRLWPMASYPCENLVSWLQHLPEGADPAEHHRLLYFNCEHAPVFAALLDGVVQFKAYETAELDESRNYTVNLYMSPKKYASPGCTQGGVKARTDNFHRIRKDYKNDRGCTGALRLQSTTLGERPGDVEWDRYKYQLKRRASKEQLEDEVEFTLGHYTYNPLDYGKRCEIIVHRNPPIPPIPYRFA